MQYSLFSKLYALGYGHLLHEVVDIPPDRSDHKYSNYNQKLHHRLETNAQINQKSHHRLEINAQLTKTDIIG
jgi:hypothetical protein